jgi:hypothetical protein
MYHTIEIAEEFTVDLESSPKHRLERMLIRRGTRLQVQIKPHVMETEDGPIEVAELFFADGMAPCIVPYEWFWFVD